MITPKPEEVDLSSPITTNDPSGSAFITRWKTDNLSNTQTSNRQIQIPLVPGVYYNFTVNWGDGQVSQITSFDDPDKIHTVHLVNMIFQCSDLICPTWRCLIMKTY